MKSLFDRINNWCQVLEQKAKTQTYGPQMIFFWFSKGRSYYKIIRSDYDNKNDSVHAFVNMCNGDIYKPASWNAPYKDARYNIWNEYDKLLNDCEWSGEYLYKI
jgi:hypothetical protein